MVGGSLNICRNCGLSGHVIKECRFPTISLGIVCFRRCASGDIEYLMVQRRHSLNFMEFILGKYNPCDPEYIGKMLQMMTPAERMTLSSKQFDRIWSDTWQENTSTSTSKFTEEFRIASEKFSIIADQLDKLMDRFPSHASEPEWSFPKGRRKILKSKNSGSNSQFPQPRHAESNRACACREFCEETNIINHNLSLIDHESCQEDFLGYPNTVSYRHIYFIAYLNNADVRDTIPVDMTKPSQYKEVRQVRWFPFEQAISNIRPHNVERRRLLTDINQYLLENPDIHPFTR